MRVGYESLIEGYNICNCCFYNTLIICALPSPEIS